MFQYSQTFLEVNGYPLHANFKGQVHAPTISWIPLWNIRRKRESQKQIYCLSRDVWLFIPLHSSRASMHSKFAVGISACTSGVINQDWKVPHFSFLMIKCWQSWGLLKRRLLFIIQVKSLLCILKYKLESRCMCRGDWNGRIKWYGRPWSHSNFTTNSSELPVCLDILLKCSI